MLNFEMCVKCSQNEDLNYNDLKPMVLSGDDKEMQCGVCNHSFKLPDCEAIKELAREQRGKYYRCD